MSRRLELTVEGGVAHLVICSPPRNSLDLETFHELGPIVRGELTSIEVEGLVVRGAGRHFSSGANIPQLAEAFRGAEDRGAAFVAEHAALLSALERLPFPTVAAISGSCLGAALELALACRFRIAATRAVLALPEVEFGLMPGLGGVARLAELVGRSRAMELVLSGRLIDAPEALSIGLVDAVVARSALVETAADLVRRASRVHSAEVSR